MTLWEELTKKKLKLTQEQIEELETIEATAYFEKMKEYKKQKGEERARVQMRK